jgi:hypothetical protein
MWEYYVFSLCKEYGVVLYVQNLCIDGFWCSLRMLSMTRV